MPKVPIDYSKTVIYKLVHKEDYDNANLYIGSTTNFTKRKCEHKSDCMNETGVKYNPKYIILYEIMMDGMNGICLRLKNILVLIIGKPNPEKNTGEYILTLV